MSSIAASASDSLTPSSIIDERASRNIFSTGYSRLSPAPPRIWIASLATRNAHSDPGSPSPAPRYLKLSSSSFMNAYGANDSGSTSATTDPGSIVLFPTV